MNINFRGRPSWRGASGISRERRRARPLVRELAAALLEQVEDECWLSVGNGQHLDSQLLLDLLRLKVGAFGAQIGVDASDVSARSLGARERGRVVARR